MDGNERLQHRYFLLHGWARWLGQRRENYEKEMERMAARRTRGQFGILVDDDYWALQYQRWNFRLRRVERAVDRPEDVPRCYQFSGEGTLTLELMGAKIPGFEPDPLAGAIERERVNFDKSYRQKAHNALLKLREHADDENPVDWKIIMDHLDWEDMLRDAQGY